MNKRKFILFIFIAIVHLLIGFLLMGAGHGWVTGFYFSITSLIFYQLAYYAFVGQNKRIAVFLIGINICLTILMTYMITLEGEQYFFKTLTGAPILVTCYFVLWIGWLALAILTLFKKNSSLNKVIV